MATLIFGKVFASMFTGSMCGAGAHVFAVMTYVIANMQPNRERVEYVRLNPKHLAGIIGEPQERIEAAIRFLCASDAETQSPDDGGRRLVLESPFVYRVVNGRYYRELKDEEDRLAKGAARSARYREKKRSSKNAGKPLPGEALVDRVSRREGRQAADDLQDSLQEQPAAYVIPSGIEPPV